MHVFTCEDTPNGILTGVYDAGSAARLPSPGRNFPTTPQLLCCAPSVPDKKTCIFIFLHYITTKTVENLYLQNNKRNEYENFN